MNLFQKVLKWLSEGKTEDEIVALCAAEGSKAADIAVAMGQALEAKKATDAISAKKAGDAADDATKKAENDLTEKVTAKVIEDLKSKTVNPFGAPAKIKQVWSPIAGKLVDVKDVELYTDFNRMLKLVALKKDHEAQAISKAIDQENDKQDLFGHKMYEQMGLKATPNVGDSSARGGYGVPDIIKAEIYQQIYSLAVVLGLANKQALVSNNVAFPTISAIAMSWVASQGTILDEKNPVWALPKFTLEKFGGYTAFSNELLEDASANVIDTFKMGYASAAAEFIDEQTLVGCITNNADEFNGIAFDNYHVDQALIGDALSIDDLCAMEEDISAKVGDLTWMGNRTVRNDVRKLKDGAGRYLFETALSGVPFKPLGYDFALNKMIPNTIDIANKSRTTGSKKILTLGDWSKFIVATKGDLRIATSSDYLFLNDVTVMKATERIAFGEIFSNVMRVLSY